MLASVEVTGQLGILFFNNYCLIPACAVCNSYSNFHSIRDIWYISQYDFLVCLIRMMLQELEHILQFSFFLKWECSILCAILLANSYVADLHTHNMPNLHTYNMADTHVSSQSAWTSSATVSAQDSYVLFSYFALLIVLHSSLSYLHTLLHTRPCTLCQDLE